MHRTYRTRLVALIGSLLMSAGWSPPGVPAAVPDPGVPGPRAVIREEYNFGDTAFTPPRFPFPGPVEFIASVHAPADLAGGPFPLVVFLHGRHAPCSFGDVGVVQWPCLPGREPI